jgi:hypothetical protein
MIYNTRNFIIEPIIKISLNCKYAIYKFDTIFLFFVQDFYYFLHVISVFNYS